MLEIKKLIKICGEGTWHKLKTIVLQNVIKIQILTVALKFIYLI